ncbi:MAG: hypothetical protein AB7F89_27460, partial [Pirellulaceae bacterium]
QGESASESFVLVRRLGLAVLLQFVGAWLVGAEAGPDVRAVTVGFQGTYRTGFWGPVHIELEGGAASFEGTLAMTVLDGDGLPVRYEWSEDRVAIPAQTAATVVRYVKFGRGGAPLRLELVGQQGGQEIRIQREIELPVPVRSDRPLILHVGSSEIVAENSMRRGRSAENAAQSCSADPDRLPDVWFGYESVDTILVTTSDLAAIQRIGPLQVSALRRWVELGGKLILCVGAHGETLLGAEGSWSALAPGPFAQQTSLRNTSVLESFAGATTQLPAGTEGIPMTMLGPVSGRIELSEPAAGGMRPLVVRRAYGLGQVVFVALDLDRPPLANWPDRPRLVQRLLRDSADGVERVQDSSVAGPAVQFGYSDISGQLRSALDQFPGVTLVAFSWVAGLLLLYVLLIGPADFFLLRDVLGQMRWTWLTFPLIVAAFVAVAVLLNVQFRGAETKVNRLELVDIDHTSGTVRGTSWLHVYSPRSQVRAVDLEPQGSGALPGDEAGRLVAWHGLPGAALGGLDGVAATVAVPHPSVVQFTGPCETRMAEVPFPVASTRSLIGRWWGRQTAPAETSLNRDADGLLRGELLNPLSVELVDCIVYFENWVYRLDTRRGVLAPGERTQIDRERALNLQWRLSGRRVIDSKEVGTAWDQNTLDVPKILEMMMFHGAVGGESYTRLANRYQAYIDLSPQLWMGRAMLVGRARTPAVKLQIDGQSVEEPERPATYYRVLFPVKL